MFLEALPSFWKHMIYANVTMKNKASASKRKVWGGGSWLWVKSQQLEWFQKLAGWLSHLACSKLLKPWTSLYPTRPPSLPLYQAHLAVVKTNRTEFKLRTFERHANVAANNSSWRMYCGSADFSICSWVVISTSVSSSQNCPLKCWPVWSAPSCHSRILKLIA